MKKMISVHDRRGAIFKNNISLELAQLDPSECF